jgi:hypothetical protein
MAYNLGFLVVLIAAQPTIPGFLQCPSAFLKTCLSPSSTSPNHVPCTSLFLFVPLHNNIAPLTFFHNCLAPFSDPNERAYFWFPGSEATSTHELLDSPEAERLYIDQGEILRPRVERDEFCDDEPGPPKATEGVLISGQARRVPYTITVRSSPALSCTRRA